MAAEGSKENNNGGAGWMYPPSPPNKGMLDIGSRHGDGGGAFHLGQVALRVVVIACTVAGAVMLSTSQDSLSLFGIVMNARYSYSSSLRFKLGADCAVSGLTVLSVVLVLLLNRPQSNPRNYFYLFLLDLVSLLVLLSGCSAATAIGYIGRYGQPQSGWMAICDKVPKFCHKTTLSIASSFVAVFCLLVLTVISPYKLQSTPRY